MNLLDPSYFAAVLYTVNMDIAIALPIVYFVSFIVCVLLREFTHGIIRYALAILFAVSFIFVIVEMMLDYQPWDIILAITVLFGCTSGLWRWIRDVFKDIKKV